MTTIERPTEVDPYVAAVARALAGLPEAERHELLDDLADHLAELAADDDGALSERLGSPEAYAAEFVASAGVEVPDAPTGPPLPMARRVSVAAERARQTPAARAVAAFLPELRPGWWVLRAWAALAILAAVAGDDRAVFPIPDPVGNGFVALVALAAAVVGSVHLGRRVGGADRALTAVGLLGVAVALGAGSPRTEYVYDSYGPSYGALIGPDGQYIQNIWPYDAAGNPLEGVFLFDQDGRPVDVGDQPTQGVAIPGLFPQPQATFEVDPRTGVEDELPVTAPSIQLPRLPTTTAPPG